MTSKESGQSNKIQAVDTTCRIIEALKDLDGAGVTELANHLDLPKSSVYNHLMTLQDNHLVNKVEDVYGLSYRFLNFGMYVRNRSELYQASKPELTRLAEETGVHTNLLVEEFGRGVYLLKIPGQPGIAEAFHERRFEEPDYLHYSATGKAILAHYPEERVHEIVAEHGLPRKTSMTICDLDELLDELETIRERGYALNDEEEVRGTRAVGVPIRGRGREVLGGISASGPVSRMTDERFFDELPKQLIDIANIIEVTLETKDGGPSARM